MKVPTLVAPQTSPDTAPQEYAHVDTSADTFGKGVFEGLSEIGQQVKKNQLDAQSFDTDKMYSKFVVDWLNKYQQAQTAPNPNGAANFAKDYMGGFATAHDDLISSLRSGGYNDKVVKELDDRLVSFGTKMAVDANEFQFGQLKQKAKNDTGELADNLSGTLWLHPEEKPDALVQLKTSIDKNPYITDAERQTLYDQHAAVLRTTAGTAWALQHPEETIQQLAPWEDPSGKKGPAPQLTGQPSDWYDQYAKNVGVGEGGKKADAATNAMSSAHGKFQFLSGTWNDLMTQHPELGLTADGRSDPTQEAKAMQQFTQNSIDLAGKQGVPVTPTNLYLYHVFGNSPASTTAERLIGAPDTTPVRSVISDAAAKDNPTLAKMSVGDLKKWAFNVAEKGVPGVSAPQTQAGAAPDTSPNVPTGNSTGNPLFDDLTAEERLQVLGQARTEANRQQVAGQASLEIAAKNQMSAALAGLTPAGTILTQDQFTRQYGQDIGQQKYAEYISALHVGTYIRNIKTMSNSDVLAADAAAKPTDSNSPTIAIDLQRYDAIHKASQQVLADRAKDPAQYVMSTFPDVASQFANAQSGAQRQQAYAALNTAYDKLGIPATDRKAMPDAQLDAVVSQFQSASPAQRVGMLTDWHNEMGGLFDAGMSQLNKRGMNFEAYIATVGSMYPGMRTMLTNAVQGNDKLLTDKSYKLEEGGEKGTVAQFNSALGATAHGAMNGDVASALYRTANALYAHNNGPTVLQPNSLQYQAALREAMGSSNPNDTDTGYKDMSRGRATGAVTVLPPGTTGTQFEGFKEALTNNILRHYSFNHDSPRSGDMKPIDATDIANEGVFVQVAPGQYQVYMGSDGKAAVDRQGRPYLMHVTPAMVRVMSGPQSRQWTSGVGN